MCITAFSLSFLTLTMFSQLGIYCDAAQLVLFICLITSRAIRSGREPVSCHNRICSNVFCSLPCLIQFRINNAIFYKFYLYRTRRAGQTNKEKTLITIRIKYFCVCFRKNIPTIYIQVSGQSSRYCYVTRQQVRTIILSQEYKDVPAQRPPGAARPYQSHQTTTITLSQPFSLENLAPAPSPLPPDSFWCLYRCRRCRIYETAIASTALKRNCTDLVGC